MAAHGDDLRYFYSPALGRAVKIAVTDAASAKIAEALAPGRYLVHFIDMAPATGRIWVRQGTFADVEATTDVPSFPMDADGIRAIEITVRPSPTDKNDSNAPASEWDGIAAIAAAGVTATLIITKISRDKR